jgi:hypothetical protein
MSNGENKAAEQTLERQIADLTAIEAIKKLKAQYCAYCDDHYDPEGIAGLFVEDGVWEGESFGHHVGREAIESFFRRISGEIVFAAHLVLNPIIDVEGMDRARGKWRLIMPATVRGADDNVAKWLVGAYDERYIRVDGVWMFQMLNFRINFYTPHLESWAGTAVL